LITDALQSALLQVLKLYPDIRVHTVLLSPRTFFDLRSETAVPGSYFADTQFVYNSLTVLPDRGVQEGDAHLLDENRMVVGTVTLVSPYRRIATVKEVHGRWEASDRDGKFLMELTEGGARAFLARPRR